MSDLPERVAQTIAQRGLFGAADRVVVGVSGGADSLVLLHVLLALQPRFGYTLLAATLDHGLRGAAGADDVAFVRRTAERWGVPVISGAVDVPALARARQLGIEEAARQARYTFLLTVARSEAATHVAVGHHRDDQAETVLMHLIRGSGLDGLRGMLPLTSLASTHVLPELAITTDPPLAAPPQEDRWPNLVRPLLYESRAAIEAYAAVHDLHPRQDASNRDLTFFRNRLRHEVLPLLETLNPRVRRTLARLADVLQADTALLETMGHEAQKQVVRERAPGRISLDRAAWLVQPLALKRILIRQLVGQLRPALRDLAYVHVAGAVEIADHGRTGATATLPGGLVLRVEYDTLELAEQDAVEADQDAPPVPLLAGEEAGEPFRAGEAVRIAVGEWVLTSRPLAPQDDLAAIHADPWAAALAVPADATLQLRARQPGDRFAPRGMEGRSQKLADTWINMRVAARWRDRIPLLLVDGRVAWFVVPVPEGIRARVAEFVAMPAGETLPVGRVALLVRWSRVSDAKSL